MSRLGLHCLSMSRCCWYRRAPKRPLLRVRACEKGVLVVSGPLAQSDRFGGGDLGLGSWPGIANGILRIGMISSISVSSYRCKCDCPSCRSFCCFVFRANRQCERRAQSVAKAKAKEGPSTAHPSPLERPSVRPLAATHTTTTADSTVGPHGPGWLRLRPISRRPIQRDSLRPAPAATFPFAIAAATCVPWGCAQIHRTHRCTITTPTSTAHHRRWTAVAVERAMRRRRMSQWSGRVPLGVGSLALIACPPPLLVLVAALRNTAAAIARMRTTKRPHSICIRMRA